LTRLTIPALAAGRRGEFVAIDEIGAAQQQDQCNTSDNGTRLRGDLTACGR